MIISVISVCNIRVKEKAGKEVQAKKSIPMIISMISVCNTRVKEKVGKEIQAKKSIEWRERLLCILVTGSRDT